MTADYREVKMPHNKVLADIAVRELIYGGVYQATRDFLEDPPPWFREMIRVGIADAVASIAAHPSTGNPPKVDLLRDWDPEDDE